MGRGKVLLRKRENKNILIKLKPLKFLKINFNAPPALAGRGKGD